MGATIFAILLLGVLITIPVVTWYKGLQENGFYLPFWFPPILILIILAAFFV